MLAKRFGGLSSSDENRPMKLAVTIATKIENISARMMCRLVLRGCTGGMLGVVVMTGQLLSSRSPRGLPAHRGRGLSGCCRGWSQKQHPGGECHRQGVASEERQSL